VSDAQSIRFEPARPEHADIFIGMMQALEQADPGATPFDEQRRRLIFDQFVRDSPYGRAWLIIQGERPVGYVILTVSFSFEYRGYDAFIDELYIAEESRGRGIGRRAMEFVETVAQEMGVNAMHLEVSPANAAALELYRRSGYADHGRYLMTKWLGPGK
jgi:ribosomal protein S18 acetylase RimI-like enzyme